MLAFVHFQVAEGFTSAADEGVFLKSFLQTLESLQNIYISFSHRPSWEFRNGQPQRLTALETQSQY